MDSVSWCVCIYGIVMDFSWILQIDEHVQREIINHRSLKHPNIIRFKEVRAFFSFFFFFGMQRVATTTFSGIGITFFELLTPSLLSFFGYFIHLNFLKM